MAIEIEELTNEEAWQMLNEASIFHVQMSIQDFIDQYSTGALDDRLDTPGVMAITMLLPLVGIDPEWPEKAPTKQ